jgi:hypothetical protein
MGVLRRCVRGTESYIAFEDSVWFICQGTSKVGSDRTKQVAHYVIARSRPELLGATKLNKVMWFADVLAYRMIGKTITGQESYQKQRHGPVPNNIVIAVRSLINEGAITRRDAPTPTGIRHEYLWLKEPNVDLFSAQEIDILNQMIDVVCENYTAASISEFSHDPLWEETPMLEQIDIGAASVNIEPMSGKYLEWALSSIERLT